jgi:DNA primase
MPVIWREVARGIRIEDFDLFNALRRIDKLGDLWKPLLLKRGRFQLEKRCESKAETTTAANGSAASR